MVTTKIVNSKSLKKNLSSSSVDDERPYLSAFITEDGGEGLKWWMMEYKMMYFNSNFVFLLPNSNGPYR